MCKVGNSLSTLIKHEWAVRLFTSRSAEEMIFTFYFNGERERGGGGEGEGMDRERGRKIGEGEE